MDGRQATRAWVGAMVAVALAMRVRGAPLLYRRVAPTDMSFGLPGTGIHAHHVLGVATADFVGSVALAVALAALSGGQRHGVARGHPRERRGSSRGVRRADRDDALALRADGRQVSRVRI